MKNIVTMCSIVAATAGTALASIAPVSYTGPLFGVDGSQNVQGDPTGGAFFVTPGLAGAGGAFLAAGSPVADTTVGAIGDTIGLNIDGVSGLFVTSSAVDNGGGNFDISILLFTDGADIAPAGFIGGGSPLDTLVFFMGAPAGGTPLSFSDVALTNSATIELFDAAGGSVAGPFDISGFANFSALGGGWDGSLGVGFGAGSAGAGVTAIEMLINVTVVPAPAGLATLALGGLVATRRRRS